MTQAATVDEYETTPAPFTGESDTEEPDEDGESGAGKTPDDSSAPTRSLRDDLIAAAEEAKAKHNEEQGDEEAEKDGKKKELEELKKKADAADAKGKPESETPANAIAELRQKLATREKARSARIDLEKRSEEVSRREQELSTSIEQTNKIRDQFASMMNDFRADPLKVLQAQGFDRDKLAEHIVKAGTPEAHLQQELETTKKTLSEVIDFIKSDRKTRAEQEQAANEQRRKQTEADVERQFLAKASVEVAPNLHRVAKLTGQGEAFIVAKANRVSDWFKSETGNYPSWDEIIEYLEDEASTNLAEVTGAKPSAPKPAGQRKAIPRTLSADLSSERRSGPATHFEDLDPTEQRKELIRVAEEAKRQRT